MLAAWAPALVPAWQRIGAESLWLHADLTVAGIRDGLPEELARRTLAARLVNRVGAETVLGEQVQLRGGQ